MAIYRGPGGSGDATQDAASEVLLALAAKDAAQAAQAAAEAAQVAAELAETNAETAETNAETAETNAETAETNAETAATNAASSASAASTSATNAAASASTATTQATNAASSASAASTSASNASTSATNAASSASTATTQATNASNSASSASTSATNAANSATSAATSATNAANSATAAQTAQTAAELAETNAETAETNAETAETNAAASASSASTSASNAASSASSASTSASNASTSATNASNSASSASTSATNASNSASSASTSATNAANSATSAANSATAAAASAASINLSSIAITGGTIDNTAIGGSTAAAGAFTTLASNGATTFTAGTASTSTTTGTAVITGGLGVSGRINAANFDGIVGANTAAAGTFTSLTDSGNLTFTGTGNRITGDMSNATVGNRVAFQTSTANSSTSITAIPNGTGVSSSLALYGNSDTANSNRALFFISSAEASLRSDITGTGTYLPLTMYTGGSERLRIDTSGNVGIGTSSPTAKVGIPVPNYTASSTSGMIRFQNPDVAADSCIQSYYVSSDGSDINIGANSFVDTGGSTDRFSDSYASSAINIRRDGVLTFRTNTSAGDAAERMRITSTGDVGIGTTSPAAKFHVSGGNIRQEAATDDRGFEGISSSTHIFSLTRETNSVKLSSFDNIQFWTDSTSGVGSGTERMRIDSTGNVGIGTTSPGYKLQVNGGSSNNNNDANTIVATGTNHVRLKVHTPTSGGFRASLVLASDEAITATGNEVSIQTTGSDEMQFATGGTERMRIDSSGNVMVATTSSAGKLNVAGQVTATGGIFKANGAPSLSAATAGEAMLAPESGLGALLYGNGTTYDVTIGSRGTNVALGVTANTINLVAPGNLAVTGSVSKGSGSFRIEHPLPQLAETHHLVHSFIEGPQADLIYRGKVNLVGGTASVNIDSTSTMTEGTFVALCRDVQCFTTNESDWIAVRGKVVGNILTIEAQDLTATSTISWMVIGERKDKHMYDTDWTDENGKVIVEPLKSK